MLSRRQLLIIFCFLLSLVAPAQSQQNGLVGTWEGEMLVGKAVKITLGFEGAAAPKGFIVNPDGGRAALTALRVAGADVTFQLDRGDGSLMTFSGKLGADGKSIDGLLVVSEDGTERGRTTWKARKVADAAPAIAAAPANRADVTPQPVPPSAYNRGLEFYRNKKYTEAIAALSEGLAAKPTDTGMLYLRGRSYHNKENFKEAVSDLTAVIENSPKAPAQVYLDRASSLIKLEEYDKAIADANKALALEAPAEAYLTRGNALYQQGIYLRFAGIMYADNAQGEKSRTNATAALADYEQFIKLKPQDYRGYLARGDLYFARWNVFDETKDTSFITRALNELDRAIALAPEQPDPYDSRSIIYGIIREHEKSKADARKADELRKK
ncbi:MAG TPA: tetratricopeptide repeat protein [Abditibacteriaceae bacterium]|jgi:tetratricopeptide (TPR) repeat protein